MNKKDVAATILDKDQVDPNKPLSEKELSSLIRASKASSFKTKEIKKEINNSFKKVSLHEIAKQAQIKKNETVDKEKSSENIKNLEKESFEAATSVSATNLEDKATNSVNEKIAEVNDNNVSYETDQSNDEIIEKEKSKEENPVIAKKLHEEAIKEARKKGFDEGRAKAFSEIKDGSDAAIANLKNITEQLSKVDNHDLSELEKIISNKVLELSKELSGKIITALPADFLKKIKNFTTSLQNIEGKVEVFISEDDFKVLEKNKDIKKEIINLNISQSKDLEVGEIELKVNGVNIINKIKKESN